MAKPSQPRQPRERQARPERACALQTRSRSLQGRDAPAAPRGFRAEGTAKAETAAPAVGSGGRAAAERSPACAVTPQAPARSTTRGEEHGRRPLLPPGDHTRGGPGSRPVGRRLLHTSPWGRRSTSGDARGPDPTKPGSAATGQLGPQRGRSSVHTGSAQDAPRISRGHLDSSQVSGGS